MPRDDVLVLDIVLAATDARNFVYDMEWVTFRESRLHQHAVIRALEIIGEAAGKLSVEFTSKHAHLPWRDMINMRNRLIHAYSAVRIDVVWDIVQNRLPEILATLEPLVPKDDNEPPP